MMRERESLANIFSDERQERTKRQRSFVNRIGYLGYTGSVSLGAGVSYWIDPFLGLSVGILTVSCTYFLRDCALSRINSRDTQSMIEESNKILNARQQPRNPANDANDNPDQDTGNQGATPPPRPPMPPTTPAPVPAIKPPSGSGRGGAGAEIEIPVEEEVYTLAK